MKKNYIIYKKIISLTLLFGIFCFFTKANAQIILSEPSQLKVDISVSEKLICSGGAVTVFVKISGGTPPWTITYPGGPVGGENVEDADGTNDSTFIFNFNSGTLTADIIYDSLKVTVKDKNNCTVIYEEAEVQVKPVVSIITHPISAEYCQNHKPVTALTVEATGSGTLTYQWYKNENNSNAGGTEIVGSTEVSYTPDISQPGITYYYVQVTDSCGTEAKSNPAEIKVIYLPNTINLNDQSLTTCLQPVRDINLNNYIFYTPKDPYTYNDIKWFDEKNEAINGSAYSTSNLPLDDVKQLVYKITEKHCEMFVPGEGKLYVKGEKNITLTNNSVSYCYSDDIAFNINLRGILGVVVDGTFTPETPGLGAHITGTMLNGNAAYAAGLNVVNGIAEYKINFTSNEENSCVPVGTSVTLTIKLRDK